MSTATLTSKGQVTIPKSIRELLSLRSGDRLDFKPGRDGVVSLVKRTKSVQEVAGMLHRPGMKPIAVEDYDRLLGEAMKLNPRRP